MQDSHLLLLSRAPEKVEDGDKGQGGRGKGVESAEICLRISANAETGREKKSAKNVKDTERL